MMQVVDEHVIAEHMQEWARWYTRLRKISDHIIRFPTWEEELRAGDEAWDEWDKAFLWLEAHGIYDHNILYDPKTEQARLAPDLL